MIGLYTKAILGAVAAFVASIITALSDDGSISSQEWVTATVALVVAAGVIWAIPNVPESVRVYGKAIAAGVLAALAVLGTALTDGAISPAEWLTLFLALGTGSGLVGIAPNAKQSDYTRAA